MTTTAYQNENRPVGFAVDEVSFEVEKGKIRELALATRAEDPVHTDIVAASSAGFATLPATLTHSIVAGHHRDQKSFVEHLGLALDRVMVGSVKWIHHRPAVAGDALTGARRVLSDVVKSGAKGTLRLVTLRTDFVDSAGEIVTSVDEVLIERGTK